MGKIKKFNEVNTKDLTVGDIKDMFLFITETTEDNEALITINNTDDFKDANEFNDDEKVFDCQIAIPVQQFGLSDAQINVKEFKKFYEKWVFSLEDISEQLKKFGFNMNFLIEYNEDFAYDVIIFFIAP